MQESVIRSEGAVDQTCLFHRIPLRWKINFVDEIDGNNVRGEQLSHQPKYSLRQC